MMMLWVWGVLAGLCAIGVLTWKYSPRCLVCGGYLDPEFGCPCKGESGRR